MTITQNEWRMSPGAVGDLEAWIEFGPAHYCMGDAIACRYCDAGRKGNHGRGSVNMRWYLRGHDAAAQFVVYTGWHHPLDPFSQDRWGVPHQGGSITPADVGFHSLRPWYDGMDAMSESCHLLNGRCYYDGSGLAADEGWRLLLADGDAAVWVWLHQHFVDWLNERTTYEKEDGR